ncbi:diaminopropionate ammonia-lyase [Gammaproteobacteria bacterium]|nr:diaminopropionate ammonia-lyase [Gammaproteobacteria bacterium]
MTIEFTSDDLAATIHRRNKNVQTKIPYPDALKSILSVGSSEIAREEIHQWNAYAPTPLQELSGLAKDIGIDNIYYKDEATRFGLGSFKALGGAYEVLWALTLEISRQVGETVSMEDVRSGKFKDQAAAITVVSATDGNHGRSVAWGAQNFGCGCRINVHAEVSKARCDAIEAYGATLVRVDGAYDDSVRACAHEAEQNGWFIVSDTSYPGYMDLPRQAMAGYTVMVKEIVEAMNDKQPLTHVFVQAGCGGLAAAVCGYLWDHYGADRPRFVVVEPTFAPCLYNAAEYGPGDILVIQEESVMAGLSCGEVSQLAWKVLEPCINDFVAIPDETIAPVMRQLAVGAGGDQPIVAGESAVAGLAAMIACTQRSDLAAALDLDGESRVLLIGSEGATDPEIYEAMVGAPPAS